MIFSAKPADYDRKSSIVVNGEFFDAFICYITEAFGSLLFLFAVLRFKQMLRFRLIYDAVYYLM